MAGAHRLEILPYDGQLFLQLFRCLGCVTSLQSPCVNLKPSLSQHGLVLEFKMAPTLSLWNFPEGENLGTVLCASCFQDQCP